jgi:hypothetical protein
MVRGDEQRAPAASAAATTRVRQLSTHSSARITAGIDPVCPTISALA